MEVIIQNTQEKYNLAIENKSKCHKTTKVLADGNKLCSHWERMNTIHAQ